MLFLESLRDRLRADGFNLISSELHLERFASHQEESILMLAPEMYPKKEGWIVKLVASVQSRRAHDMIVNCRRLYQATIVDRTFEPTLSIPLGMRVLRPRRSWRLRSDADLPRAIDGIFGIYAAEAKVVFDQYSDPRSLLKLCLSDERNSRKIMPIDALRAEYAVVLTYIALGIDAASSVSRAKLNWLEKNSSASVEEFSRFLEAFFRSYT